LGYFDDIQFVDGAVYPRCLQTMDTDFPGTYSLEFLLAGKMYYGVDNGLQIVLDTPTVFWHHHHHTYQYGPVNERGWDQHWVIMKGTRARRMIEEGCMPLSEKGYIHMRSPDLFCKTIRSLIALVKKGDPRSQGERVILLERLLCMMTTDTTELPGSGPAAVPIQRLADSIARYPCRAVDFEVEATKIHLSYSRFRNLFKQYTDRAPHEYLLQYRMKFAARKLHDPALSISEVAYLCGYDDPAQFSKLFSKKIGISPRQYRSVIGISM